MDLDAAVLIERGRMQLYPAAAAAARRPAVPASKLHGRAGGAGQQQRVMPPPGQGLNQPALLTFRRMALRARSGSDWRAVEAFRGRLLEASARLGGVFVHYDPDEGVWMLKVDRWL